jgi:hypothetical protein
MKRVLEKLRQDKKEFINAEELKDYCDRLYFNYKTSSNYLISRGYLVNIFENIYYVKSKDEVRNKKINFSLLELVAKSLKLKNVKNWYFGLYTALNLMKLEYDNQDENFYVINDQLLNNSPTVILGKKFRFLRFKNALFNFGIINNKIKYSDHEKTILDLLYLWESNHINENRILLELSKLLNGISEEKILEYVQYYPDSNQKLLKKAIS